MLSTVRSSVCVDASPELAGGCSQTRTCTSRCVEQQQLEVPAWGIRTDGTLCFVNAAAERLFGIRSRDYCEQPWNEVLAQLGLDPREWGASTSPAPMGTETNRIVSVHGKGSVGWFQIVRVSNQDQGLLDCVVEVAIDISRWVRMESYVRGIAQSQPVPIHAPTTGLTPRELEVLGLLASGLSQHEIARKLFLSYVTIRTHVQRVLPKMGARSIQGAVARYLLDHAS